jgi:hypothetical protein
MGAALMPDGVQLRLAIVEDHRITDVTVLVTCSCGEVIESHAETAVLDEWQRHAQEHDVIR